MTLAARWRTSNPRSRAVLGRRPRTPAQPDVELLERPPEVEAPGLGLRTLRQGREFTHEGLHILIEPGREFLGCPPFRGDRPRIQIVRSERITHRHGDREHPGV